MLSSATVKVGDAVSFGRKRGATAYGTVERVSNKTATVRLTKQYNSNPPGALFRVPFSLLSPADEEVVKPTPSSVPGLLATLRVADEALDFAQAQVDSEYDRNRLRFWRKQVQDAISLAEGGE